MSTLLYQELTGKIIGAAMEVHGALGQGFLESVYEEAFAHELSLRNIPFERQKGLSVYYKERRVKEFICDFLIDEKVLVEIKAMKKMTDVDKAQIMNYLKATRTKIGILFNFGERSLKFERIIL